MKTSIVPLDGVADAREQPSWLDRLARKLVLSQLARLRSGEIIVHEPDARHRFGNHRDAFPFRVSIEVHHPSVWSDVAFGGTTGAGEAYIRGAWSCDDLVGVCRVLLRNRDVLEDVDGRMTGLTAPLQRLLYWLSRNTRNGSRRNISAHYDLGNNLFALFLDPTMMYSSAYYASPRASLEEAAVAKLDRICEKIGLRPEDHVLEIGTGWGGFAIHAARHYGCRVTTTTISLEQYEYAQRRVHQAGLADRVTVLLDDYRDLEGQYDKLVSIEMIEAVGHQYLSTYFATCNRLLKPTGVMLLQAITIADQYYESALREVDYIKRFIFPGGFLPSISALSGSLAKASDLQILHIQDIGQHYARTLADWRQRFLSQLDKVRQLGYSEAFIRMWEFYLCYCEGGFTERNTSAVQILMARPATFPRSA